MTKTMLRTLLWSGLAMGTALGGGAAFADTTTTANPDKPAQWPLGASPAQGPLPTAPSAHAADHGLGNIHGAPSPTTTGTTGTSGTQATPKPSSSNEQSPTATTLGKVHLSNQKEIEMGKVAEKGGRSKEVKSFGKDLIKDHTAADKKVVALAKEEKIDLAGAGSTTDHLPQPGADFDLKFAQMMLEDHTHDITEVSTAIDTTSDAKLKELLTNILPTLKKHKETAQKIIDRETAHAEK